MEKDIIKGEEVWMMILIEDKAQQSGKHIEKNRYWSGIGIDVIQEPLPVGDYILANDKVTDVIFRKEKRGIDVKKIDFLGTYSVCVDTKKDLQELIGNVCGKQHSRFRDECILAQNNGIKLYILVENKDGINSIDELKFWNNPRKKIQKWITTPSGNRRKVLKYPNATSGVTLAKALVTMQERYGVSFKFCVPDEAGETVLKLLKSEV